MAVMLFFVANTKAFNVALAENDNTGSPRVTTVSTYAVSRLRTRSIKIYKIIWNRALGI